MPASVESSVVSFTDPITPTQYPGGMGEVVSPPVDPEMATYLKEVDALIGHINGLRPQPPEGDEWLQGTVEVGLGPAYAEGGSLTVSLQGVQEVGAPEDAPRWPAVIDREGDRVLRMLVRVGHTVLRQGDGDQELDPENRAAKELQAAREMVASLRFMHKAMVFWPAICLVDGQKLPKES